jgi:hypothetical protein
MLQNRLLGSLRFGEEIGMRHILKKTSVAITVALALLLLTTIPLVAQPTATFYLNGVGSGNVLGGVYTSPYSGEINPPSSTVPVICDDFSDESFVPEEWTTYVTSLSSIIAATANTGVLRWGGSSDSTLSQVQGYEAAALLSIGILNTTGVAQEEYSFALWNLFDSNAFADLTSYYGANNAYETAAQGFLTTAEHDASTSSINGGSLAGYLSNYNVTIYSYDSPANGGMTPLCGSPLVGCAANGYSLPPQEFITVTAPEASTPALLAADILGLVAILGLLRKRLSRRPI